MPTSFYHSEVLEHASISVYCDEVVFSRASVTVIMYAVGERRKSVLLIQRPVFLAPNLSLWQKLNLGSYKYMATFPLI